MNRKRNEVIPIPNVAIYCRISIEDRNKAADDASASIQNQQAMLRDYCKSHGWDIAGIYTDDGYSGTDRRRPGFCRMLRDCEKGGIDIVLCKDQSRFSRDTVVIEEYLSDRFPEWGVRFIGIADNADTDSESYGTMRLFASAYNEMYVRDISSKIRRTLASKREQGQFIGAFAPYGYRIDPDDRHHLVTDEAAAAVVRRIFELYVSGAGYRTIVRVLNGDGILSPSAYKRQQGSRYVNRNAELSSSGDMWTQSTIARILGNEVYTGTLVQGRSHSISYKNRKRRKVDKAEWVRTAGAHEAVIDAETWRKAQERLNSNTRVGRQSQELSPLSGKVRCAVCGRPMKRSVYYNKAKTIKYYSLQCADNKTGAMNCCNSSSVSGLVLEKAVLGELNRIVGEYCRTDEIRLRDIQSGKLGMLERELAVLRERKAAAEMRLVRMYKDRLDGIISDEDYSLFRKSLSEEEKEIAGRIAVVSRQAEDYRSQIGNAHETSAITERYAHFDSLSRSLAEEFISFIEIGTKEDNDEREIHIHWKI